METLGRRSWPRWRGRPLPHSPPAPQPQCLSHGEHSWPSLHLLQATFLPSQHFRPREIRFPSCGPSSHRLCPQEKRIASLDAANARLMSALTQLKERYSMQTRNGISPTNPTKLQITENGEFRNSSNC